MHLRPALARAALAVCAVLTVTALPIVIGAGSSGAVVGGLRPGLGFTAAGGDFVGFYRASTGTPVYCLDPRKALPRGVALAAPGRYPGVSPAVTRQLAYALSRWGSAATARAAAIESQLLNTIVGNRSDVARRSARLPAALRPIIDRRLALTRRFAGPYVTTVRTSVAVAPGQSATGTVTVTAASGRRLPDTAVTLSGTANVSLPRRVVTGRDGVATFSYRALDVGEVRVTATAAGLPATLLRTSRPGPSEQHLVSWGPATTARAVAHLRYSPGGFAHSYACSTTCDGRPDTTLTACAPPSGAQRRVEFRFGSRSVRLTFAAGDRPGCRSVTVVTRDGDHVSAHWQFRTRHGWSRPVAAPGTFVVDCPPAVPVGVTMTADCARATVTIGLAQPDGHGGWVPLVNTGSHRLVLQVDGRAVYADHGQTAVFSATYPCGARVTLTARSGVERAGGRYNYGAVSSVTTP